MTKASAELEHVPCPGCGADRPRPVLSAREFRFHGEARFYVVRCGPCGLLYTNPRPTPDEIDACYPARYYREDGADAETPGGRGRESPRAVDHVAGLRAPAPLAAWEARAQQSAPVVSPGPIARRPARATRRRVWRERWTRLTLRAHFGYPGRTSAWVKLLTGLSAWRLRRGHGPRHVEVLPWIGRGRLLDFGFGGARFLRLQRDRGWTVAGVDFNADVVRWAREEHGLEAEVGRWPGPAMSGRMFDCITAWHVLEHVADPTGWIAAAVERLAPGGLLLVCCPNAGSWGFRWFGEDWFGLDLPRHFSHFTTHDLVRLLREPGLQVERIRPQHQSLYLRESVRLRAGRRASRFWAAAQRLTVIWRFCACLSNRAGASDAVIVYARKPGDGRPHVRSNHNAGLRSDSIAESES